MTSARFARYSIGSTAGMEHWVASSTITRSNQPGSRGNFFGPAECVVTAQPRSDWVEAEVVPAAWDLKGGPSWERANGTLCTDLAIWKEDPYARLAHPRPRRLHPILVI